MEAMWFDDPQLEAFRERLKVLTDEEATMTCRQGEPVNTLMVLREGL